MLEINRLNAFYGDSHILHNVDLQVSARGRVALLGRNGAGKSTLLNSIVDAGPSISGQIIWNGVDLAGQPTYRRARAGICLVPEDRRILADLTVLENLHLAGRGSSGQKTEDLLQQFPMLVPLRDRKGGLLSGGQQQMLAIARAKAASPKLLLLDEPTEGLAPVIVEGLVETVNEISRAGEGAVLLCEQNVWFSRRCTDYVYILDTGSIVFRGSWAEFDANHEINTRYLAV
jgi:ABC-type branched-subunit amino acid transport system ATPase component